MNWLVWKVDMKDPLMVRWVLRRLEETYDIDALQAEKIEGQLFSDISIKHLLDRSDDELLTTLLHQLPAKRFSNNLNTLIARWPEWTDTVAYWSAQIIAQLDPEEAYKLFSAYLVSGQYGDLNRFYGVVESLKYLKDEDSKRISNALIDDYIRASLPDEEKSFSLSFILKLAWEYEHLGFDDMLHQFLLTSRKGGGDQYEADLSLLCRLFVGSEIDFNLICDRYHGYPAQTYASMSAFFKPWCPLSDIDSTIKSLRSHKYKNVISFFNENCDAISNQRVRNVLNGLLDDETVTGTLDKKEQKPFFYSFILGCLTTSMRIDRIDLENFSLSQVIDFLSADIEEIPFFDSFVAFIRKQNRDGVTRHLIDNLGGNINNYGGSHIIEMMGELKYDKFLPRLVKGLDAETDFIFLAAQRALLKYGDKALDCIIANFKNMNISARISALSVVRKIGGPKVAQLVDEYFDDLWPENKEMLLEVIEAVPDQKLMERLAPKTNKGQFLIDRSYIILNKLLGHESLEVDSLTKKLYKHEKKKQDYRKLIEKGPLIATVRPYIDVELKCRNCGDQNTYKVKQIMVSHKKNSPPYIAEEITCVNCNKISEFDFTAQGLMAIMAETLRLGLFEAGEEREKAMEKGPIKYMATKMKGKEIGLEEGIQAYLSAIENDPADPDNYVGLGNVYRNTNQYAKAEGYFRKTLEIDPSYMEPYYCLALIARTRKDYKSAFQWLEKGRKYIQTAKYRKEFDMEKTAFARDYAALYNEVMEKSGKRGVALHPGIFHAKLGRNDPCPCGSGKKYKKCCLKQQIR